MSKIDENNNENVEKKKRRNILKIINSNSEEKNYDSTSGQNKNRKMMFNNSFYENSSSLESEDFKNNVKKENSYEKKNKKNLISFSHSSNSKSKIKNRNIGRRSTFNNNTQTNTAGDLIQRNNISLGGKYIRKRNTIKKMQTIESISYIEEDNQLTIRQRLTQFFDLNDRLFYIKIIVNIIITLSYIFYLFCTYKPKFFKSLNYIDFFICSVAIFDHIINLLLAHHIFLYLFSIESILNFLIEIPPFFSSMCSDYHIDILYRFINITRILRLAKSYFIIDILQPKEKSVKYQIFNIIFTLFLIIFLFAGVIQILDLEIIEEILKIEFRVEQRNNLILRKYFHHYLYFIIVSLTTVGFGEIMPKSIMSQAMIIILVIVILVVVPDQINELINLSNSQTIYERKEYISSEDVPFVVLIGNISLDALRSFSEEYFHKDHGKFYRHIVLLINKYPSRQLKAFLNEKDNNKFIIYLQGDPMKNSDLLRADILKAKSCIIFSNKNTKDPFSEDQRALLLAIFVKKFYYLSSLENLTNENNKNNKVIDLEEVSQINIKTTLKNNNFKIFLQLNKSESYQYYYSTLQNIYRKNMTKDQLLVIESLKMNLLSKSCLTPGIISLLSNLIISSSTGIIETKNEPEWLREYSEGTQYEIYKFSAERQLLNYTYQQLAIELYNKFHSILIALEINFRGNSLIKLNPQNKETINEIIEKGVFLKAKKMKNGADGQLYSVDSEDESYNESFVEGQENKSEQLLKSVKLKKQIKIYFYLISKDKEVIDDIVKMDVINNDVIKEKRKRSFLKITMLSSLYNFTEDKINASTLRNLNIRSEQKKITKKMRKESIFSEEDKEYSEVSSISDEEIETKAFLSELVNNNNNIKNFYEYEKIINNYYTLETFEKNYLITNEIMRQGIKDISEIQHHVVICGIHPEIIHFILPLRAKYLTENMLKWIVILAPVLPQEIYDTLNIFPKIIFIEGDPLNPENLFRANIKTADIAVILNENLANNPKKNDICYFSYKNLNSYLNQSNSNNKKKSKSKLEEENLDSATLFIYKAIRKINNSIKIITELLVTRNIEFLLPAKYLQKLYDQRQKPLYNSAKSANYYKEIDISSEYEMTPVFASGEIYLPSLVDKIIAQMFYNSNLLIILKLMLEGEKHNLKKKEKKLNNLFNLTGSNLFMIPCEIKSESFGEMFKRLLANGILCIALYRKNIIDNFYYVYTNPRKTTLIRESDFIFVLSGTKNIEILNDKNIFTINKRKEEEGINNDLNLDYNFEIRKPSIFTLLQESVQKNFNNLKGNIKNISNNNIHNINNINNKNDDITNINNDKIFFTKEEFEEREMQKINMKITEMIKNHIFSNNKENDNNFEDINAYSEVDELEYKANKSMDKLKFARQKVLEFEKEINNYIKEEINNEFFVYLNKEKQKE